MKKLLIIVNGWYPYGKSEDFLANEVQFINGFDEVVCFPILAYGDKSLKDNIYFQVCNKPITFFNPESNKIRIKGLLYLLRKCWFYKELYDLIKSKKFSIRNLKELFTFLNISFNAIYSFRRNVQIDFRLYDVTLYSYWMHCSALVAISIASDLNKITRVSNVITRCHRFDLYEYAHPGNYIPFRQYIIQKINKVYSISDDGLRYLSARYPDCIDKFSVARLGTDDHGLNISSQSDTLRLVSCSWMRPVKRVNSIALAISKLDFRLDWVHYGDGEDFELVNKTISTMDNPLINCVLKGACNNREVLRDYSSKEFDVFINVSENEGVPVSIMEAMSFGKIIVATDVGGTSEIVEEGVNGFLLKKDFKNEELVSIIIKIASMKESEFYKMCRRSREIWEERCSAGKNYSEFYRNI